jgi:hypothetical protein
MRKILLILFILPFICISQRYITNGKGLLITSGKTSSQAVVDFLPTDIAGLQYWTYGDKGIVWSGTGVSQWTDQSGKNFNATQSVAAKQYDTIQNAIDGHTVVYYNGNSNFLTLGTQLGKPANWTIFVVGATANNAADQCFVNSCNSAGQSNTMWGRIELITNKLYYIVANGVSAQFSNGYTTNTIMTNNNWDVITQRYTSGNDAAEYWVNNTSKVITKLTTTSTTSAGTAYPFSIGRYGDYDGFYLAGGIAEVIIFNVPLSEVDRLRVENYLHYKYPSVY